MSMIFNPSAYQPPGVYVSEEQTPLVAVVGIQPTVVGIVGPGIGYRVATEAITLTGVSTVLLTKAGIDLATVSVVGIDGAVIDPGEYTLVAGPGPDSSLTEEETDNTTTIARSATDSEITSGSTVYVTYRYADEDYFRPKRFQNFDDVKAAYGPPIDTATGAVISPLSMAAMVALQNGAATLVLVDSGGSASAVTRTQLDDAYNLLDSLLDVNVVVPLPVGITGSTGAPGDTGNIGADLRAFVETSAAAGIGRIGILGMEAGVTVEPTVLAAGIHSKRVVLAWPNRLLWYDGFGNRTITLPGYYLAAAYAGRVANLPVQTPLTRKGVTSFVGFPPSTATGMTTATKNTWSAGGVAVTESARDGSFVVRHGTTTDPDQQTTRELNLVRAGDALVELLQRTIERSGLIGGTISEETPLRVKGVITGVLDTSRNAGVIVDYEVPQVRIQSSDPTVIEVKFMYTPAYPLNFIVVQFSINPSTGVIAGLAA